MVGRDRVGKPEWVEYPAEQGAAAASAGLMDDALALVARALEIRDPFLLFSASPAWRAFRADPRGREMLMAVTSR